MAADELHASEKTGGKDAVGIGQHGACPHSAEGGIHLRVEEIDPAAMRIAGFVGEADMNRIVLRTAFVLTFLFLVAQVTVFVGIEIDVHRVLRHYRREQGIVSSRQVADGHQRPARPPGDRGADLRERQVELGGRHRSLGGMDIRRALRLRCAPQVEFFVRDRVIVDQSLGALVADGFQLLRYTRACQLRLGVFQCGPVGTGIDQEHQVALFDILAFLVRHSLHVAAGAGA